MAAVMSDGGQGPSVIWDFDPNLTDEIYKDLGVEELSNMEDKAGAKQGIQKLKGKAASGAKGTTGQGKNGVRHTTPSPASLRTSTQNHIHNGTDCSCKRRILESSKQPDSFSCLSDEVILAIFRWLPIKTLTHCAKVSRRWRQLAYDEELWRRVDLSSRNFQPHILGMILRRGVTAAKVSRSTIAGPVFNADDEESAMEEGDSVEISRPPLPASTHLSLVSLDLSACITDDPASIQSILERCHALQRLSLESCSLNEGALHSLAAACGSIQVLNLAMCRLACHSGLVALLTNAQQLTCLNMSWVNLSRSALAQVIPVLSPSLQQLNLSGYREKLKDEDVTVLVSRCKSLVELDLSDSTVLTNHALAAITESLAELRHLSLSRCYDIPHYAFVSVTEINTMKALDVFGLLQPPQLERLKVQMPKIVINSYPYSSIGRPTFSSKQPRHIWGVECQV
ncbi:S-phase kinase-associated protein 2-like [Diadema setosum]|uniref:S-phase kinase-associated protein 2-like n=1 Tax=Diadema setosum TaxID=31175 RepID=UPI003B3B8A5C